MKNKDYQEVINTLENYAKDLDIAISKEIMCKQYDFDFKSFNKYLSFIKDIKNEFIYGETCDQTINLKKIKMYAEYLKGASLPLEDKFKKHKKLSGTLNPKDYVYNIVEVNTNIDSEVAIKLKETYAKEYITYNICALCTGIQHVLSIYHIRKNNPDLKSVIEHWKLNRSWTTYNVVYTDKRYLYSGSYKGHKWENHYCRVIRCGDESLLIWDYNESNEVVYFAEDIYESDITFKDFKFYHYPKLLILKVFNSLTWH